MKISRSKSDVYSRYLEALDRAAVDRAGWADACDSLAELVSARGVAIVSHDISRHDLSTPHSASLTEAFDHAIKTGWNRKDLRLRAWSAHLRHGFLRDQDLISPEVMMRHPYYAEFLKFDLLWSGTLLFEIEGDIWGAAVHAGPGRGPFTDSDRGKLMKLREPLILAAKRAHVLGKARIRSVEDMLATSRRGIVVLDWSGKIATASSCGEALLKAGYLVKRGKLDHDDLGLSQRIRELTGFALGPEKALLGGVPAPVLVRAENGVMISVDAIPLPRDFQSLVSNAAAIVTLHVVDSADKPLKSTLTRGFGLTEREAELTSHLVDGHPLSEAAVRMGITIGTARHHLKSVFAKTGTNRQSELVLRVTRPQDRAPLGSRTQQSRSD